MRRQYGKQMDKKDVLDRIKQIRIVPVIRTHSRSEAEKTIQGVLEADFNVIEITMTIPNAVELIKKLSEELEDKAIIGAGTVLDAKTAQNCIEAGAGFIVSPIFEAKISAVCQSLSVAFLPGALTPTEIFAAWKSGADAVKVFPVSAMGGASYIKAIKSVFPEISVIPTGGVNIENAVDFFNAGAFAVGIGSGFSGYKNGQN